MKELSAGFKIILIVCFIADILSGIIIGLNYRFSDGLVAMAVLAILFVVIYFFLFRFLAEFLGICLEIRERKIPLI